MAFTREGVVKIFFKNLYHPLSRKSHSPVKAVREGLKTN